MNLRESDHLEGLVVDGTVIIKTDLKKKRLEGRGLDSSGSGYEQG